MSPGHFLSNKTQMYILLFGVVLTHLGSYMVLPLLPIFLKIQKGMPIENIGMILAVSPFMFQAGSLSGGVLADRFGRRTIIALGAWINAAAIAGYALFNDFWLFVAMGLLSGLGVGLNGPATRAAISVLASGGKGKTTAFSMRGIAANIGTSAAGLLAFFVLGGASALLFYVSAGIFVALGLLTWLALPKGCGDAPCQRTPLSSYKDIFKNKAFVVFSLVSVVIWAVYTQFSLGMPLRAEQILPDPSAVSLIWTINSVIVILLQTPVSRLLLERIHPLSSLALGMLFIGAGLGSIYWAASFSWLMFSGILFIIGEMFIVPTIDSTVSQLAAAKMVGVFFGVSNFVSGIGESAGKFTGGQLLSGGTLLMLPWAAYTAVSAVVFLVLLALRSWKPMKEAFPSQGANGANGANGTNGETAASGYDTFKNWILGKKRRAK